MMECGHSWLCVGINMSAEGVAYGKNGIYQNKEKRGVAIGNIISEKIVANTLNQVIKENAEREGLNKDRGGARGVGWYFGVVSEPQALHYFGVMVQQLRWATEWPFR